MSADRKTHDPVSPVKPSASAGRKKAKKTTEDGEAVQSFDMPSSALGTLCRNRCRVPSDPTSTPFTQGTQPTPFQSRVFGLLAM